MYEVEQHFFFEKFGFALKILYLCSMIKRGYRVKLLIDKRKVAKSDTDTDVTASFLKLFAYRTRMRGTRKVYTFCYHLYHLYFLVSCHTVIQREITLGLFR